MAIDIYRFLISNCLYGPLYISRPPYCSSNLTSFTIVITEYSKNATIMHRTALCEPTVWWMTSKIRSKMAAASTCLERSNRVSICGAFPLHGTALRGSVRLTFGGFPLGTVLGTFFSSTSAEVPSEPYRYQNVTCKLCWSLIGRRKSPLPFVVCWGSTDVPLVDSRGADPARAWWSDAELKRFSGVTAVEAVQL